MNDPLLDKPALHVLPTNDEVEHFLTESCWCHPEEDNETSATAQVHAPDGYVFECRPQIWVHHSFDGREFEKDGMWPKEYRGGLN